MMLKGYASLQSLVLFISPTPCMITLSLSLPSLLYHFRDAIQDVYLRGPHVTGPTFLSLPASGTGVYSFTFSPLASPSSTPTSSSPLSPASSSSSNTVFSADGSLTFAHPLIGEFWYGLKLTAKPPAPVQLPTFDENVRSFYFLSLTSLSWLDYAVPSNGIIRYNPHTYLLSRLTSHSLL